MSKPRPLFITGNKRSGTTVLTNLLNAHPQVFLSHEADTAWILFQAQNGPPDYYKTHPFDSRLMLDSTLKYCKDILKETLGDKPTQVEIENAFFQIEKKLLQKYLKPSFREQLFRIVKIAGKKPKVDKLLKAIRERKQIPGKENLLWLGDKKHAQHLDPEVRSFLKINLPTAKYIHIVRNPTGVVASMMKASRQWLVMPDYFKGTTEQIFYQWTLHEEWALKAKRENTDAVLIVRLEDLCTDPGKIMVEILNFLELELIDEVIRNIPLLVHYKDPNQKYESFTLPGNPRTSQIMQTYGY